MAGEHRSLERRDLKMGRSKFPGKPTKCLNRRRVNLVSCDLPQHNDSSSAADNICLGLSVFHETFGDSEQDESKPFPGFLPVEIEEAMAEARLQQREVESECNKQGTHMNLWSDFQTELFSIFRTVVPEESQPLRKSTVCFDGGGDSDSEIRVTAKEQAMSRKSTSPLASPAKTSTTPVPARKVPLMRAERKLLHHNPTSKSLQSQAAKRLLEKAKKVNVLDSSKKIEKKFVLPVCSARSSRVIKPNKRFVEEEVAKKKIKTLEEPPKVEEAIPARPAGRVILREARLQLEPVPRSLGEGPFSSPTPKRRTNLVSCGVCGAVRFYKFIKQATKFGIRSCESCRKFIAKMMKTRGTLSAGSVKCAQGTGQCMVPAVVRNADWSTFNLSTSTRCPACWLKLCLKHFLIPAKLKARLMTLLPPEIGAESVLPPRTDTKLFAVPDSRISFFESFSSSADKTDKPKKDIKTSSLKVKKTKEGKKVGGKRKSEGRQRQPVGGPRVKHVCRSASIVLGQAPATFPEKPTPEVCCAEPVETPAPPPPVVHVKPAPKPAPPVAKPPVPVAAPSGLLQQRKKKPAPASDLVSMDFWEIYDPEEVCETGFSLIGSEPFSVRALCYLCGSAGLEKLVHCACCCEPYHEFCVGEGALKRDRGWRWDWVCPRCTICASCGRASGQQLTCVRCDNSYHTECVGGRLPHSPDRPWVCGACLRCKSCNAVDVTVFVGNLPLCKPCFVLRQRGNFCPLCQKCYKDDDYDCKMMECGGCQSWVHAKCEGVSDEKYQVLSFLPESVEFVCRMCCVLPPAPWWLAVEAELKAGYLGVLKALSKNRTACKMLKWSPRKICSCRRRESAKQVEEDPLGLDGDRRSPALASDSGVGSADDEVRPPVDEEACFCFLEVDSYNSRSKPFSPNLLSIKKKVVDSEYSSLTQFHEDMRSMVETTQSDELMDVYHQAMKEVFPWFDSRAARILGAARGGSLENTPVKSSPVKQVNPLPCLVPVEELQGRALDYFYQDCGPQDTRICLLCKMMGDGASDDTGRLLYCGQNEWVHCNCALWSGEVFEEIDGSLQNVHGAIARGRSMRCPHCQLKGASVGCCARNCAETFHFACARASGCVFLEDKTVYCRAHVAESAGRMLEAEKEFELRRPVYVELDKRRSKPVEASAVQVAVGALRVEALGRFVPELSDLAQTIMPADLQASRVFWSSREPWRLVRYRFSVRLVEPEQAVGVDLGVNLTVDHSRDDAEARMRTLAHFQIHLTLPPEPLPPTARGKRKRRLPELLDEPDNQDLLPPEIEEAILKELSHDMLEGISVQDIFQDMSERDEADEEWGRARKPSTLRTGNWNATKDKDKDKSSWKRKAQEGKENKMVGWCARLLQVDGAVDSSSGSEAGESPGRSVDLPVDIPQLDGAGDSDWDTVDVLAAIPQLDGAEDSDCDVLTAIPQLDGAQDSDWDTGDVLAAIPQLDGAEDSDYESCDGLPDTEEAPVECGKCQCTYRTQRSYERHLASRCHEMLLSSSEDDEPAPPPPPAVKPARPRTYARRRPVVAPAPAPPPAMLLPQHSPMPVILQELPFQPMMQYIMEPQKPMLVSNGYQMMLPSSPVVLGSSSAMFEVVTDPHTGGMFLTQPSPQPVLYNMETIVSNTVMQTNQFMSSSYSQTSTQVYQASKQVMNMPTGYVLGPSDLICLPVSQPMPQPAIGAPWATPAKPKPPVVKVETPRPPPAKPKPRSRALVDFINNFSIDSADMPLQEPQWAAPVRPVPPKPMRQPARPSPTVVQPARPQQIVQPVRPQQIVQPARQQPIVQQARPQQTVQPMKHVQQIFKVQPQRTPCYQPKATPPRPTLPAPSFHHVPAALPSPTRALTISMPSLDDSPPNSCDTSPVLRPSLPPPPVPLSLPALSPVHTFSPPHPLSPRIRQLSSPHSPSPSVQHSPYSPLFYPPSPFLSPRPVASPLHCVPSSTPPLPAPASAPCQPYVPTHFPLPPLSPKTCLPSTCDPLPPIGCTVSPLHFDQRLPAPPVTPPRVVPPPPVPQSPLTLQPPRFPPHMALQPLAPQQIPPASVGARKGAKEPAGAEPRKCPKEPPVPGQCKELRITPRRLEPEGPMLVYDVVSDDGLKFSSTSLADLWQKICESVQEVRTSYRMPTVQSAPRAFEVLGLGNHGLQHLLEQLPGVGHCDNYQPKYFKQPRNADDELTPVKESLTGCARSEGFAERKEVDKFGWLASRHRKVPRVADAADDSASNRKTNNLPMAMRYRALREASKATMFVYRSKIHGMGLFCTREIDAGDMVIEYSGELIRSCLTDKREKLYTDRGIGCYMFRIDDHFVVDATMRGNSARFINHSCEPNCYSKVVDILGRKHIIIFALRRIGVMEELTYDYKFPFEDVKISCHCQSKKCRKYLN